MKALLIPTIGKVSVVEFTDFDSIKSWIGKFLSSHKPEDIVVEVVSCEKWSWYIDEEGKLKHLPINRKATAICYLDYAGLALNDCIVGNMLIVGPPAPDGDDTGLPDTEIARLKMILKDYRE